MIPIPPPPRTFDQWALESFNFLVQILTGLLVGQQTLVVKVDTIVTALDDIQAEVAGLKADVAALGDKIESEIADLAAALAANDPAKAQAVLADLKTTRAQLGALGTKLSADDAPAA